MQADAGLESDELLAAFTVDPDGAIQGLLCRSSTYVDQGAVVGHGIRRKRNEKRIIEQALDQRNCTARYRQRIEIQRQAAQRVLERIDQMPRRYVAWCAAALSEHGALLPRRHRLRDDCRFVVIPAPLWADGEENRVAIGK